MEEDVRNLKSDAPVTGEEMRHQAPQHKESLADRVMNLGSDAGHATAAGSHGLAGDIHNAVAGAAHHVEEGIGNLFHHGHAAPAAPTGHVAGAGTAAAPSTEHFDSRLDTSADATGGGQSTI